MKKFFIMLLVLLCACSVFAAKNKIEYGIAPVAVYARGTAPESNSKDVTTIVSEYGLSSTLTYLRECCRNLYVEAGFEGGFFNMKDQSPKEYYNSVAYAGVRFQHEFDYHMVILAHAGLGADLMSHNKELSVNFATVSGVGIGFALNERFGLTFELADEISFGEKDSIINVDYRVLPKLNAFVNF